MDAADVLYGVSMGGDGVTKVVSRRLPREVAEDEDAEEEGGPRAVRRDPPPFAGVAEDEAEPRPRSMSSPAPRPAIGRSRPRASKLP